jgi:hypothetical protein
VEVLSLYVVTCSPEMQNWVATGVSGDGGGQGIGEENEE